MSYADITAALETRLKALPGVLPTQWENAAFIPPADGSAYQQASFLGVPPENPTIGTSFYREIGAMQVTLYYPLTGGAGTARAMAGLIRDWFPRGSTYVASGAAVTIQKTPEIGSGRRVSDRWVIPVTIRYFANIQS